MTAFEDLKSQWGNQSQAKIPEEGAKQILKKITVLQKQQRITNVVLSITAVVLIAFFFYVSAYKFQTVMIGLLLMIGALAVRIGLEFSSIKTLKNLDVSTTVEKFKQLMISFYTRRKRVHYVATPLIIIIYSIGFIMLLPAFEENLSSGFYRYIVVSSIIFLLLLCLLVTWDARKEFRVLKELKS